MPLGVRGAATWLGGGSVASEAPNRLSIILSYGGDYDARNKVVD